ncbi:MAG: hypothetical protein ACREA0_05430 [bacterium]
MKGARRTLLYKIPLSLQRPSKSAHLPATQSIYSVSGGAICLESELTLEAICAMVSMQPERVVCLDSSFADNDPLKANAVQIFKTKGVISFKAV